MKRNNIMRISILPLIFFTVLTVSNIHPQKGNDKGEKAQGQPGGKGKSDGNANDQSAGGKDRGNGNQGKSTTPGQGKGNNDQDRGNDKQGQGRGNDNQDRGKSDDRGQGNDNSNKERGNDKSDNRGQGNSDRNLNDDRANNGKIKPGKGNYRTMNGSRDVDIDWGFDDYVNRKRPGNYKKVTICHHAGGENNYPVTISVSENALQAHLNHGDERGDCTINYSDRWSNDYLQSRQNVYNSYEQTWETMSYSEALLKYAAARLLGIRTDLNTNRTNYTSDEIRRREALIYELQNNVNSLENQLGYTRQKLDSDVNIIIQL